LASSPDVCQVSSGELGLVDPFGDPGVDLIEGALEFSGFGCVLFEASAIRLSRRASVTSSFEAMPHLRLKMMCPEPLPSKPCRSHLIKTGATRRTACCVTCMTVWPLQHGGRLQAPMFEFVEGKNRQTTFYAGISFTSELPVQHHLYHDPFIRALARRWYGNSESLLHQPRVAIHIACPCRKLNPTSKWSRIG
jgi:hypothetical protein